MRISDWSSDVCSSDLADAIEIGDDPAFAQQPFVKAHRLAVQVAPWPLISKRELQVTHLILERPVIRLVQGRKAAWNFASLASAEAPADPPAPTTRLGSLRLQIATPPITK